MPKVVSHTEVEALSAGQTLLVEPGAMVTPLAMETARQRGVTIARSAEAAISPAVVRQVTRQVVAKMAGSPPDVIEAVVAEVLAGLSQSGGAGASSSGAGPLVEVGPGIDYCAACIEQDRARSRTRAVLTTTGRNTKGIVARVTTRVAELGGDILDISQTLVGDYFTMIIIVDTNSLTVPFAEFKRSLEDEVQSMGLSAMMMHEDVVNSLHRI